MLGLFLWISLKILFFSVVYAVAKPVRNLRIVN